MELRAVTEPSRSAAQASVAILSSTRMVLDYLGALLPRSGFTVLHATVAPASLLDALASTPPDVLLLELGTAGSQAEAFIDQVRSVAPEAGLVLLVDDVAAFQAERVRFRTHAILHRQSADTAQLILALEAARARARFEPPPRHAPPAALPPVFAGLSPRELSVLKLAARGMDNREVAAALSISERTVKAHMSRVYEKTGAESRTELAVLAQRLGVV